MDDLVAFLRDQLDADEHRILNGWDSDGRAQIATMWTGGESRCLGIRRYLVGACMA